jgi:hypothetical protein
MIKDGQARKLRQLLAAGDCLAVAARRTDMDEKTARKYRDSVGLPSEQVQPRTWRTRRDPFEKVWPEVQARLEAEPKLRAFALFEWLQDKYPGRFPDSQRRTFERRVRTWRAAHGPRQEVMFPQVHAPGDLGASDFTSMNSLRVTIGRQPFDHMLYHFTLTYSNWESVSVCFSESFEAFSRGLQDALWKLGGVPRKHRSDSLSAAVNNLSDDREFRARYRDLVNHYRVDPQRINARKAHENGDVESSHGHLKTVIDQALLLRGSRDFATREEYGEFLEGLIDKRNISRSPRFEQEQAMLGELPPRKLDYRTQVRGIKVHSSSTIQVKRNTYSVHSRLIGHKVDVVIDADFIEVWHGDSAVQRMPRLVGIGKHAINYRHVIDSLVRKPGAFANYQYREDMFPTSHFRMAYDWLCRDHSAQVAAREYLKILQMAAHDSQDAVQDALRLAIANDSTISAKAIRLAVEHHQQVPAPTDVIIDAPDLQDFDSLLQHPDMEVHSDDHENDKSSQPQDTITGEQTRRNKAEGGKFEKDDDRTDRTVSGPSHADFSGALRELGRKGRSGVKESHRVSVGADGPGMPSTLGEQDRSPDAAVSASKLEDLEQLRLDSSAATGYSTDGKPASRFLPGPSREPVVVRQTRLGKNSLPMCPRRTTGSSRTSRAVHKMQPPCSRAACRQTGLAVG